jgi:hypothetical protein
MRRLLEEAEGTTWDKKGTRTCYGHPLSGPYNFPIVIVYFKGTTINRVKKSKKRLLDQEKKPNAQHECRRRSATTNTPYRYSNNAAFSFLM